MGHLTLRPVAAGSSAADHHRRGRPREAARPHHLAFAHRDPGRCAPVRAPRWDRAAGAADRGHPGGAARPRGGRRDPAGQRGCPIADRDGARPAGRVGRCAGAGAAAADAHAYVAPAPGGAGQRWRAGRPARGDVPGDVRHLAEQPVRGVSAGAGAAPVAVGGQPGHARPAAAAPGPHCGRDRAGRAGRGLLRQRAGLRPHQRRVGDGPAPRRSRGEHRGRHRVERRPGLPGQRGHPGAAGRSGLAHRARPRHRARPGHLRRARLARGTKSALRR